MRIKYALAEKVGEHALNKLQDLFRREFELVRNTRHPYIITLFGAGTLSWPPILAMPLMRNGSLDRYLMEHLDADRSKFVNHGRA